jgi:hypothetical protein
MLETIKAQLLAIYSECRHISAQQILDDQQDPFCRQMETLNRLATLDVDDHQVDALVADKALKPVIEKIAALKQIHGLRLERQRAAAIIGSRNPWETLKGFVYYPNYLQLAEMEFRGAELSADELVVFLGSGPVPFSLISMVRRYAVTGVGIERDPFNADLSLQVIDRLQLGGKIEILLGDHYTLPLSRYCNLVMVGADATPKEEIFAHLARTLPAEMKLSFRIYEKGLRRLFDRDHFGGLPHPLKEYRRIRPQPPVNNTSVFVVKEETHG